MGDMNNKKEERNARLMKNNYIEYANNIFEER